MVLHHIGVVVDSLAEAIPLFEVWMRAKRVGGIVEDEAQGARIQLLYINESALLELVEIIPGADAAFHRTGQFHLCFTVPDLDAEMQRLHELGALTIQPSIHATIFENRRLGFLATNSGQLLELLEEAKLPVQ